MTSVDGESSRRAAVFHPEFREDLRFWVENDRKIALRALSLVEAILRDPFAGIGKPEPLKHLAAGTYSRRPTGGSAEKSDDYAAAVRPVFFTRTVGSGSGAGTGSFCSRRRSTCSSMPQRAL